MQLFKEEEIRDLLVSVLALVLIFSWKPFPDYGINLNSLSTYVVIIVSAFLLHELAHKFIARKFGFTSVYQMWTYGILLGLVLMIFGIRFVAPGAVLVFSYRFGRWPHRKTPMQVAETGITAAVGPLTNLILAILATLFTGDFFHQMTFINAWLALVNMLPVPPLDGSNILRWKFWVWGFMFAVSLILVFVTLF